MILKNFLKDFIQIFIEALFTFFKPLETTRCPSKKEKMDKLVNPYNETVPSNN